MFDLSLYLTGVALLVTWYLVRVVFLFIVSRHEEKKGRAIAARYAQLLEKAQQKPTRITGRTDLQA